MITYMCTPNYSFFYTLKNYLGMRARFYTSTTGNWSTDKAKSDMEALDKFAYMIGEPRIELCLGM